VKHFPVWQGAAFVQAAIFGMFGQTLSQFRKLRKRGIELAEVR